MRVSLDWLKDFVDVKCSLEKITDALTMAGLEVISIVNIEEDQVMDIEVTPNRPDCLSILGIAREVAAVTRRRMNLPLSVRRSYMKKGLQRGTARVEIIDKKFCPRYVGCIVKNVKVAPSPKWLIQRLNAVGLRSINNVVDITNYVLFELGQPLHAFDLDKLEGKKVIVRRARKGESITTIDGVTRELDPSIPVIADENKPVAIAGIMGGKYTEISEETRDIFLESAYFNPMTIRKAQRRLTLASESSYRFERGVDFGMILAASLRAQEMLRSIAGGRVHGTVTDIGGKEIKRKEIVVSLDEIPRLLGVNIDSDKVADIFKSLDLKPTRKPKGKILVKVPPYRRDLDTAVDLVEEVARLYGYNHIPTRCPRYVVQKVYEAERKHLSLLENQTRETLCALGLNEIVTYTLTSGFAIETLGIDFRNAVRLMNPLSSNQEFMRPTLLSEMLEVISWNLNRRNFLLQFFELNKVYLKKDGKIQEKINLSLGMSGQTLPNWKEKSREIDFFDLKGTVEQIFLSLGIDNFVIERADSFIFKETMSARIAIDGHIYGMLGEVKPDIAKKFDIKQKVYIAEIFFEQLLNLANLRRRFNPLPRYPSIRRDISILVDDSVSAERIYELIRAEGKGLIKSIDVFDLYKGQQIEQGKKSLGYTIEYSSDEKTLKEEDILHIHKGIHDALVRELGAQIR